jgi:hypothetical protein
VTSDSTRLRVAAIRALGGLPTVRELELVREALLRGPDDLVAELRLACEGGRAFDELAEVVAARGGSAFTLLDLLMKDHREAAV